MHKDEKRNSKRNDKLKSERHKRLRRKRLPKLLLQQIHSDREQAKDRELRKVKSQAMPSKRSLQQLLRMKIQTPLQILLLNLSLRLKQLMLKVGQTLSKARWRPL